VGQQLSLGPHAPRGDAKLCISEKSAGYLPLHLGGKVDGMDARQWRTAQAAAAPPRAAPEGRFAVLGAGRSAAKK
jgi:hypothetical protein